MISSVGLFYFLEAVITLGVALKLFKSFQQTKNSVTRNFSLFFLFLTPAFLCWGLPSLLAPQNHFLLNVGALTGLVFIFIAFAFGMRLFVVTRFTWLSKNIVSLVTLILGGIIVFLYATIFGSAQLNPQGVIEWHHHPVAIIIYVTMIIFLTFFLGIKFFRMAVVSSQTRVRSLLSGFASLFTGAGGALVIMNIPWQIILFGHILLSLGIALIGWIFFFTKKPEGQ